MNQTQDAPTPTRRKFSIRTLLAGACLVLVLFFLGKSILQSQGIGGPEQSSTSSTASPSTPGSSPTATPQLTKIKGTPVIGVPGPIILMNPGIVRANASVSVSGYGFDPQAKMDLVVKQLASDPGQPLKSTYTDKSGSFTATFPLPEGMSTGPFILVAREHNSNKAAQSNGSIANGAASVKMGALVGKVGDVVGWSGSGFASGEAVNVYWNSLGGQPIAIVHADGGGSVRASVQVPFAAIGNNSFIFVGTKSQSPVTASFLVLSLYPTVKPSSYALKADNPLSFSGAGFGPNERVLIFLNGTNGAPIGTAQTDAHGTFKNAGAIVIPYTLKGKQTLVFIGEESRAPATIGFTVLPYNPVAQASIYGGLPGTTLSFYASNFAPNEIVHVYVGRGSGGGGNMVACFQTDAKGRAGAQGSYTIPGNAQGKLTFTLVGNQSGASAAALVTVMPSAEPVQVPAQPPFTCPLDQPAQAPTPANGAPGGTTPGDQTTPPGGNSPTGHARAPIASSLPPLAAILTRGTMLAPTRAIATPSSTQAHQGNQPSADMPTRQNLRADISISDASTPLGLVWLGLIVVLVVILVVRFGLQSEDTSWARDFDADPTDEADAYRSAGPLAQPAATSDPGGAATPTCPLPYPHGGSGGNSPKWIGTPTIGQQRIAPLARASEYAPEIAGASEAGRAHQREANEDCLQMVVGTLQTEGKPVPYALLVLADGLGGYAGGREASHVVTDVIVKCAVRALAADQSAAATARTDVLAQAAAAAHAELCARNQVQHTNMAAAVSAALLIGNVAHIVNIGHGRAYLYNYNPSHGLRQVTTDHTIVAALVSAKLLPPIAIYTHPRRRLVHRCVGRPNHNQFDTFRITLAPDDRLLLCSNGLWQMVSDAQIESVLRATVEPSAAVERLLVAANRNGGEGSISAIVARTPQKFRGSTQPLDLPDRTLRPA